MAGIRKNGSIRIQPAPKNFGGQKNPAPSYKTICPPAGAGGQAAFLDDVSTNIGRFAGSMRACGLRRYALSYVLYQDARPPIREK